MLRGQEERIIGGDPSFKNLEKRLGGKFKVDLKMKAKLGKQLSDEDIDVILETAAKEAFSEFLDNANLDSKQIYFVNQIVEYIVHNGMMKDLSVLQDAPFTDRGSVVEIFTDLSVWAGIRKVIETINMNAAA